MEIEVLRIQKIPVVILCGGKGLRLRLYTDITPKALVPIGDLPILVHIMKMYSHQGFNKFILALGYKGKQIKDYFMNYLWISENFKLNLTSSGNIQPKVIDNTKLDEFDITFVDTGLETPTGGRIKKLEKYIENENFFATYCDGLADVNIRSLFDFHNKMGKVATVTAVHPMSSFGIIEIKDGLAVSFKEKPALPGVVSGGFFVFNQKIFDYLDENSVLEEETFRKLTSERQLAAYQHDGFWACMDTFKDVMRLNKLWKEHYMPHVGFKGKPPWKIWE